MSKIFEALRKTESELADVAKAVLSEGTAAGTAGALGGASAYSSDSATDSPEIQSGQNQNIRSVTINLESGSPILPFNGRGDRAAEQYRIIRTKISHHPGQPRIVLVSSPMPGDGKTISAINLAAALSLQE